MRINKLSLAGVALALVGAGAKDAFADPPVTTAGSGNVTVAAATTITVPAGQNGVTVNSNNTATNNGTITGKDTNNVAGIAIDTTALGSPFTGTVTNSLSILFNETYVQVDSDGDGDLDGPYAQGANRVGIWLEPGGSFNGDIINTSTGGINIQGNNSTAIRLDGHLNGHLSVDGLITIVGDNTQGVAINGGAAGGVTGNVDIGGTMGIRGLNSIGVLVDAPITGQLNFTTAITNTGYHGTIRPINTTAAALLDADDFLQSGAGVAIQNSVTGGVTIKGIGVENDVDDDGDGLTTAAGDTNDDLTAQITNFSSAPALLIRPNATTPTNIVFGNTAGGFGLLNRGGITGNSIFDGFSATAVRIEGLGGATVDLGGGFRNDGTLTAIAFNANATGLFVGTGVSMPTFENRKTLASTVTSDLSTVTVVGVDITSTAHVGTLNNTGILSAQLFGEAGNAVAIRDTSNTLAVINNIGGSIQGQIIPTDDDPTDNVVPTVTGNAIAIDVSASTIGVTVNQLPDVVFTDDDTVDDDAALRPTIQILGSILFGSGADTLNLQAGQVIGNVSFGAGADNLVLDGGASLVGKVSDSDGLLNINVNHGTLGLAGGTLNLTTAHFGAQSILDVLLTTTPSTTTVVHSTGAITFDTGSVINLIVPSGLPTSGTNIFLTASGGLVGANNVIRSISGANTPFIYNLAIQAVPGDPNSLQANFVLKTPVELGLTPNETAAFTPIITALRTDTAAANAFSGLDTSTAFQKAYTQLLPNYASAAAELAATAIQQAQGATANRLDALRIHDSHDVSVWAQEIGYSVNRDPQGADGVKYNGFGFGLAVGIDGPLRNGQMFGLSASFVTSETTQPGRRDGELSSSIGQFNAYLGSGLGPVDLDMLAGAGVGRLSSRRFVDIGTTFKAQADADWWAGEGHAAIRASLPMQMSNWLEFRPYTALTYVALDEQGYKESGGGSAINLDVDGTLSQRLWADVGLEFAGHLGRPGLTQISPRMTLGWRSNLIDDAAKRTLRFDSGGSDFTLTDATEGEGGAIFGLGLEASNGYSTFSLNYEGQFSDQIQRNSINAALRLRF